MEINDKPTHSENDSKSKETGGTLANSPTDVLIAPRRIFSNHSIQILNKYLDDSKVSSIIPSPTKVYVDFFAEREGDGGTRVGPNYQAEIPAFVPAEDRFQNTSEYCGKYALMVWCPSQTITDEQIDSYLSRARESQYSREQALGLLFWHRYNFELAVKDLGNFIPKPLEWGWDDQIAFQVAFQLHGKEFDLFQELLPHKTIGNVIQYYYGWKKRKLIRCRKAQALRNAGLELPTTTIPDLI